jgi:type IV secretion system protein TrbL
MSLTVIAGVPNPLDVGKDIIGGAIGGVADSAVGALANAVAEGVGKVIASLGTVWVKIGTPQVATQPGGTEPSPAVAFMQSQLWWFMAAAAIMAVIIGGARMAWEQRAQPGRELLKGLLTLVVVSGCGLAVISLAMAGTDEFSRSVVDASLQDGSFAKNLGRMLGFSSAASGGALGPLLVIVLGLIAILVSVVQIMLMVARAGMLVLLCGALPLASAFTSTEAGRMWFRRFTAWLIAFLLYKPAAALIYAAAFKLAGSDVFADDGLLNVLVGLGLMVIAVIALPALLRFLAPMTAAMASSGGGAGGGIAAALPTGAIALGSARMAPATAGAGAGGMNGGGSGFNRPGPSGAMGATGPSGPGGGPGTAGGSGADGRNGTGSASRASGAAAGGGGAPGADGASAAGSGAAGAGAGAAGGRAAAGRGAAAGGAAAGPGGAAAAAGAQAVDGVRRSVQSGAEQATGANDEQEGPRGSR